MIGKELSMKKRSRVFHPLTFAFTFLFLCASALPQCKPNSGGWYTTAQAANGAKAYEKACASCHGVKLQGGIAPALVGRQFWLTYSGRKVSTLWSAVHKEMPMSAPGSVSAKNSTDIMAFLLQKNGVAAGTTPLNDTTDLSKALPSR
jgi:mono/diheme cytochrome c family protein